LGNQINIGHESYPNTFFCNEWTENKDGNRCKGIEKGTYLKSLNNAYTAEFERDGSIEVYVTKETKIDLFVLEFF
jgi:hypothetical protein